jgi:hypothetical protein
MALTQAQAFNLTRSSKFTARLQWILNHYANYCIGAAPSTDPGNPGYSESKALARRVQNNSGGMTGAIAVSFVTNDNVVAAATLGTEGAADYDVNVADATLNGWVEGMWNSRVWDAINV